MGGGGAAGRTTARSVPDQRIERGRANSLTLWRLRDRKSQLRVSDGDIRLQRRRMDVVRLPGDATDDVDRGRRDAHRPPAVDDVPVRQRDVLLPDLERIRIWQLVLGVWRLSS